MNEAGPFSKRRYCLMGITLDPFFVFSMQWWWSVRWMSCDHYLGGIGCQDGQSLAHQNGHI